MTKINHVFLSKLQCRTIIAEHVYFHVLKASDTSLRITVCFYCQCTLVIIILCFIPLISINVLMKCCGSQWSPCFKDAGLSSLPFTTTHQAESRRNCYNTSYIDFFYVIPSTTRRGLSPGVSEDSCSNPSLVKSLSDRAKGKM